VLVLVRMCAQPRSCRCHDSTIEQVEGTTVDPALDLDGVTSVGHIAPVFAASSNVRT
jgi:hypothetical protein